MAFFVNSRSRSSVTTLALQCVPHAPAVSIRNPEMLPDMPPQHHIIGVMLQRCSELHARARTRLLRDCYVPATQLRRHEGACSAAARPPTGGALLRFRRLLLPRAQAVRLLSLVHGATRRTQPRRRRAAQMHCCV